MNVLIAYGRNIEKCVCVCYRYFPLDSNIPDIEDYDNELKKEYNLLDVNKATWLKTRNLTSTPLLLTFKEKEPQRFIKIPGEQAKSKAYEYYERPMSYKTCLRYGHTVKRCHEQGRRLGLLGGTRLPQGPSARPKDAAAPDLYFSKSTYVYPIT